MKSWLSSVAFAACAFVAGLVCALYVSKSLKDDTFEQIRYAMSFWQPDIQNAAYFDLHNIEVAEQGDVSTIIRTNCVKLRLETRGLSPDAFSPARQPEIRTFLEKARGTISRLETQGLCSFPAQPTSNQQ